MRAHPASRTNLTLKSPLRRAAVAVTASALLALGLAAGATPASASVSPACGNGAGEAMCLTFPLPDLASTGSNVYVGLPLSGASAIYVDWGDGSAVDGPINAVGAAPVSHYYTVGGTTQAKIYGTSLDWFGTSGSWYGSGSVGSVDSWGGLGLTSLVGALNSSTALTSVPATLPSTVTDISGMFFSSGFAGDDNIGLWDTTNVTGMGGVFQGATHFDESLGSWKMGSVTDASGMFNYSGMSVQSYDATLNGWNSQTSNRSLTVGATGLYYSSVGSAAHAALQTAPFAWVLDDSGPASEAGLSSVSLSGTEAIRSTLTAGPAATYQPRLTYQWQSSATGTGSWSDLVGESHPTLVIPDLQAGRYLRVCVNANNSVGTPADLCSDATGQIAGIDPSVGTVTITGSTVAGSTLTAETPDFNAGVPAATLTYTWSVSNYSNGNLSDLISGQSGSTLLLTDNMIGRYIYVCVNDGVSLFPPCSSVPLTGPITGIAPALISVTVGGTKAVHSTVTATVGVVGAPAPELFYKWESSANGTTGWTTVGDSVSTYVIPLSQFQRYLRVTVTAKSDGYQDAVRTSLPARVTGAATPNVPRSVKGLAGDKSVVVSWTAPADNGGAAINYYKVTATPKVGSATRTCTTATGSALSCQVTGLAAGVAYRFTVKAHNSVGFGAASTQSATVTPIGITWTKSGKVMTAKFKPVSGATKYTETSTGATKTSGVCKVAGSGSARRVTCVITLKTGKSSLTVSVLKTKTVLAKATKVQTV
ncbi:MAG: fibronectin type III domain-containing protein [Actinobacteria bacterium]|nr:fibronectin type III domain-containing protein [Actinomycetota bacterium]